MWRDLAERTLPVGVVTTNAACNVLIIGARSFRTWRLDQFATASPKTNGTPGLIAIQLYHDDSGTRKLSRVGQSKTTLQISCQSALLEAEPHTRYNAHLDKSALIMVDVSRPVPPGWSPQHGEGR